MIEQSFLKLSFTCKISSKFHFKMKLKSSPQIRHDIAITQIFQSE